jgi:hypothetical protein
MRLMTTDEKRAMKAACVQAAATLIAARDSGKGQIDIEEHQACRADLRPSRHDRLARACVSSYPHSSRLSDDLLDRLKPSGYEERGRLEG